MSKNVLVLISVVSHFHHQRAFQTIRLTFKELSHVLQTQPWVVPVRVSNVQKFSDCSLVT